MHLAFLSQFDPTDVRAWSGIPYYMQRHFAGHVDRLSVVGPLRGGLDLAGRARALRARLRGHTYIRQHTAAVAAAYAEDARTRIGALRPDAVIAPSTLPIAFLDLDCPTACWGDATFESNLLKYPAYSNLQDELVAEGHEVEEAALKRASLAFFAGEHATRSAIGYYGADPARVFTVSYGPNLDTIPDTGGVHDAIESRSRDHCHLLFLGKDWLRKGGDLAVKVVEIMNRRGLPATLTVVGVTPPESRRSPSVRWVGYVSKSTEAGRRRLDELLRSSHFLLMPTRAENFGCVFSEASAYGVPSLATAVDGVPTAIHDGVNGRLFPPRPSAYDVAEATIELFRQPEKYAELARSSRAAFEERLNWDTSTRFVVDRFAEILR